MNHGYPHARSNYRPWSASLALLLVLTATACNQEYQEVDVLSPKFAIVTPEVGWRVFTAALTEDKSLTELFFQRNNQEDPVQITDQKQHISTIAYQASEGRVFYSQSEIDADRKFWNRWARELAINATGRFSQYRLYFLDLKKPDLQPKLVTDRAFSAIVSMDTDPNTLWCSDSYGDIFRIDLSKQPFAVQQIVPQGDFVDNSFYSVKLSKDKKRLRFLARDGYQPQSTGYAYNTFEMDLQSLQATRVTNRPFSRSPNSAAVNLQ